MQYKVEQNFIFQNIHYTFYVYTFYFSISISEHPIDHKGYTIKHDK
jgi:hypothetical protein